MIVSHRHRFIFIKTEKTAGTSIEAMLDRFCGEDDVVTPVHPPVEGHLPRNYAGLINPLKEVPCRDVWRTWRDFRKRRRFYNHLDAWRARCRLPAGVWQSYFKFCVERDPWDKTISHYFWRKNAGDGTLGFEDFMAGDDFPLNHRLYTDRWRRRVIVDRILSYEALENDLAEVCGSLGVPFDGLDVRAKGGYRENRQPPGAFLTRKQIKRIGKIFACELRFTGYTAPPPTL
jgi:hypothetical protein